MGILDNIQRQNADSPSAVTITPLERAKAEEAKFTKTVGAIDDCVVKLAGRLGEDANPLTRRLKLPRIYRFSDLYLSVNFFSQSQTLESVGDATQLLRELCASLLGMDPQRAAIQNVRIGVLSWMTLGSIQRTIQNTSTGLVFGAEQTATQSKMTLAELVENLVRDTDRLICGKTILILPDSDLMQSTDSNLGVTAEAASFFARSNAKLPTCQLDAGHNGECSPVPDHF